MWSVYVKPEEIRYILSKASVPEHSAEFMRAMSGGDLFPDKNRGEYDEKR